MRAGVFIVLGLAAVAWSAGASEKLPRLQAGDNVYSNVTVTTVTPTDIYFTYPGGMGNAKLKSLSPDLQEHFHYNPAKAGDAEQKQAAANAQYRQQAARQPAARPPAEEETARPAAANADAESSWGTDLPAALNRAKSEGKMVLLDFTGSDWCGWCIKFEHDVLSTDKFTGYAKGKLVLVRLDYPHHQAQAPALKQANEELSKRFGVDGFPTFVLLNSAGRELGRQVGYLKGGPEAFVSELEDFGKR